METTLANRTRVDLPVAGMDCQSCAAHIQDAVKTLPGVDDVRVLVSAERATVTFDPDQVTTDDIKAAIGAAGYSVPDTAATGDASTPATPSLDVGQILGWGVLGIVAVVIMVAAVGEWLGIFDRMLERLPWWVPALAILVGGWPVLRGVVLATRRLEITSHSLMTVGAIASITIGEWATAALIVFFMRFGEWLERLTTERNREALQQLVALQPVRARVVRDGQEIEVPVAEVAVGEVVVVRPGERIPVDGTVVAGEAPVDQAPITGESIPVDKTTGDTVFAATIAQAGSLTVRADTPSTDTTFAQIVRLVEEAESQKTPVQRFADRFSTWYLPLVLGIAIITYLVTGQVVNAVAVLVVACACAITIATPVVVLASVGTAARRGLLIKGGVALEQLARVDTVVMDKTGTLTHGAPRLTNIVTLNGVPERALLEAVATVEGRSEHPIARAMVDMARARGIAPRPLERFQPLPGRGVVGSVDGAEWAVGNRRLMEERGIPLAAADDAQGSALEAAGKTAFFVAHQGEIVGVIGVADVVRPEVKRAIADLKRLGVRRLLLLTGDHSRVAAAIAGELGLEYRADLLPQDKIAVVKHLQAEGAVVMMVGDGINDAPALAQANVGVAMGAGTGAALEAADVALLRNDWTMVPEAIRIGRRGVRTIQQNLGFTALYNVLGLALAAVGILPPVWAAAAQSLPDVAIMLNSARLLRGPDRATERLNV
jgi:P-type Cu+ transporter